MKFTMIMGTHNPKMEWLQRALASAEGLFDEYIIVDDGSKVPLQLSFLADPSLYKLIRHETNKGFYEAKNTAVKAATGDVMCTLDDDDYFDRGGTCLLKEKASKTEGDVYHFQLQMFGADNGIYGGGAEPKNLTSFNSIPGISWFKKSMWEAIGGFTYEWAEDWDFWLRAFKAGYKFTYFPEIVYYNNRRPDSRSAGWTGPMFDKIRKEVLERNGYY